MLLRFRRRGRSSSQVRLGGRVALEELASLPAESEAARNRLNASSVAGGDPRVPSAAVAVSVPDVVEPIAVAKTLDDSGAVGQARAATSSASWSEVAQPLAIVHAMIHKVGVLVLGALSRVSVAHGNTIS
jgi:hypothetical protein